MNELRKLRDANEFVSAGRTEQKIPTNFIENLRQKEKVSEKPVFKHSQELIGALRRRELQFDVVESNVGADFASLSITDTDKEHAIFETSTSYHLKGEPESYSILDDIPEGQADHHVRELTDGHVLHCGRALQDLKVGSFILGTEKGSWSRIPHVARHLDAVLDVLPSEHAAGRRKSGFLVARRVTATHEHRSQDNATCIKLHTEDIHPIELFEKFRSESLVQRVHHQNYGNVDSVLMDYTGKDTIEESDGRIPPINRELFSKYATPDSPLLKCTDSSFGPFTTGYWDVCYTFFFVPYPCYIFGKYASVYNVGDGVNDDQKTFAAALSLLHGGCIEYSDDFDVGFNFNCKYHTRSSTFIYIRKSFFDNF